MANDGERPATGDVDKLYDALVNGGFVDGPVPGLRDATGDYATEVAAALGLVQIDGPPGVMPTSTEASPDDTRRAASDDLASTAPRPRPEVGVEGTIARIAPEHLWASEVIVVPAGRPVDEDLYTTHFAAVLHGQLVCWPRISALNDLPEDRHREVLEYFALVQLDIEGERRRREIFGLSGAELKHVHRGMSPAKQAAYNTWRARWEEAITEQPMAATAAKGVPSWQELEAIWPDPEFYKYTEEVMTNEERYLFNQWEGRLISRRAMLIDYASSDPDAFHRLYNTLPRDEQVAYDQWAAMARDTLEAPWRKLYDLETSRGATHQSLADNMRYEYVRIYGGMSKEKRQAYETWKPLQKFSILEADAVNAAAIHILDSHPEDSPQPEQLLAAIRRSVNNGDDLEGYDIECLAWITALGQAQDRDLPQHTLAQRRDRLVSILKDVAEVRNQRPRAPGSRIPKPWREIADRRRALFAELGNQAQPQ